jgi:hypothetical protein
MNNFNIHRLFIASVLIAIKYNEDDYYDNNYYAKVGGISLSEMNKLEFEFVKCCGFQFFVELDLYLKYKNYLTGSRKVI